MKLKRADWLRSMIIALIRAPASFLIGQCLPFLIQMEILYAERVRQSRTSVINAFVCLCVCLCVRFMRGLTQRSANVGRGNLQTFTWLLNIPQSINVSSQFLSDLIQFPTKLIQIQTRTPAFPIIKSFAILSTFVSIPSFRL